MPLNERLCWHVIVFYLCIMSGVLFSVRDATYNHHPTTLTSFCQINRYFKEISERPVTDRRRSRDGVVFRELNATPLLYRQFCSSPRLASVVTGGLVYLVYLCSFRQYIVR